MDEECFGVICFARFPDGDVRFLLVRHKAGYWSFPKGHPLVDEEERQTAARELFEETGIVPMRFVNGVCFTDHYVYQKAGRISNKRVKYFLAEATYGSPVKIQKEEISDYKWSSYNEAVHLLTFETAKELLRDALDHIS